jgi:hypothetical protein
MDRQLKQTALPCQLGGEHMTTKTNQTARPCHPEAVGDEVLIGNMFAGDFHAVGWKTKRKAKSYQLDGTRITTAGFVSVLVSRAEIEAAGVAITLSGPIDHRW